MKENTFSTTESDNLEYTGKTEEELLLESSGIKRGDKINLIALLERNKAQAEEIAELNVIVSVLIGELVFDFVGDGNLDKETQRKLDKLAPNWRELSKQPEEPTLAESFKARHNLTDEDIVTGVAADGTPWVKRK